MRSVTRSLFCGLLIAFITGSGVHAQPDPDARETAATGRLITSADIDAWKSIRQNALSPDGRWFAYVVAPNEGDATLILRETARDAQETRIPLGDGGGSISISGDSKWLGYIVAPPRPPEGRGRGRSGRGRGRGAEAPADSAQQEEERQDANTFVLMNLATGEKREFERIRRFAFNSDAPTWVAMQGYPAGEAQADAPAAGRGGRGGRGAGGGGGGGDGAVDLLLYHIESGERFNMGRVNEYGFDESGDWLAYTMDTPDQVGNGVQLRNMKTNVVRSIESDRVLYRHIEWVDSSAALSVMRGRISSDQRDTAFSIVAFTAFRTHGPTKRLAFDPEGRSDFPDGWQIAFDRAPRYAEDMSIVYFGIREQPDTSQRGGRDSSAVQRGAPGAGGRINQTGGGNDEESSLILWHAKDPRLQSQQIVQEQSDRNRSYEVAYRFAEDRFLRLETEEMPGVNPLPGDRWAYGTDDRAYQWEASHSGRRYVDVYRIDLVTGERTLLMEKRPSGGMSPSPDGRKLLFWGVDGHYWVLDIATGDSANITKDVATSFIDTEDDHNNLYPPSIGSRGWTEDGSAVVLYDNWDLWKVPVKPGERAVNLTGDGREKQIRYRRIYNFGEGSGGRGGRGGRGGAGGRIDLSKPLYIGTYGEWTKREGLSRVDPGRPGANSLFFEDASFDITKADDADVYLYTRETFTEYPDYHVFNPGFRGGYRITDVNPQRSELAWSSGSRLIDYTSDKGDRLQAALYLPANYEPGRQYPLLVMIYERRSQNKNNFVSPSETRAPDVSQYTNAGYAVLDPDIVYRVNDPGMSAVWCVIPAVRAAIATGIVDEARIGLWGHSWGGYQTAFLVTQTDIFAAAIAGAPLTDMVSMYSSVYWNTGGANQAIFESSQGRFKGNFLENYDAYIRNSPAFHADRVTTPLIIMHNDKDGAVDFNQGITYFNTLRELGKQVILLQYAGENHGVSRPANQRDYARRMREWFDHYLMDEPAPKWITDGIPRLDMPEHLRSRRDTTRVTTASGGG